MKYFQDLQKIKSLLNNFNDLKILLTLTLDFATLVALKSPLHGIMKEVVEAIT